MKQIDLKYRLSGKALPPQPIKISTDSWAGKPVPKQNGSEPQEWHCPPFVEASTYGVELVYPFETECHVINIDGEIRFEFDFAKEPGVTLNGGEFATFFPHPPKYYLFNTGIDIQAPEGHVVRTNPHPRFYTDDTETVPVALAGHLQTQWWPKRMFVVFKVPRPGTRHIFRKGEGYAQVTFVPHQASYHPVAMTPEQEAQRANRDAAINGLGSFIAQNVWHNPSGTEFKDHYKVLARAFGMEGDAGVEAVLADAMARERECKPVGATIAELFKRAEERLVTGKPIEARNIYLGMLARDPRNAEAAMRLSRLLLGFKLPQVAFNIAVQAVMVSPQSADCRINLAEMHLALGEHDAARKAFGDALILRPNDPELRRRLEAVGTAPTTVSGEFSN